MQILEREKEFGPRVSFHRNGSTSSSSSFPFLVIDSFSRKSFSYDKLPQEPLNLTVIKLDGSSFDIDVAKTATVAELKQAVEAAFSHLPKKGSGKVSWSHVWGQFCLCYKGQKLLCDTDSIGLYGIQEGNKLLSNMNKCHTSDISHGSGVMPLCSAESHDMLHFIRHTSVYYNLVKSRSQKEDVDSEQPSISSSIRDYYQERAKKDRDDYCSEQKNFEEREKKARDAYRSKRETFRHDNDDNENDCVTTEFQYKLAGLVRGWFSYRRLPNSEPSYEESPSSSPSKLNQGFFSSFRNMVRIYSSKDNSRMETWNGE